MRSRALLTELVRQPLSTDPIEGVDAWWEMHSTLADRYLEPADVALAAGFASDRPAWAFASGYQAALRALFPGLPSDKRLAFAMTEAEGNHPRDIHTTIEYDDDGSRIDGQKSFVTLGAHADVLLVVATRGEGEDGRPRLVVAEVPANSEGVTLENKSPSPFVPEIPHARATFDGVRVPKRAALRGDGYADFAKPFRTIEDAHVHTALVGWLLQLSRRFEMPIEVQSELVVLAQTTHQLAETDPKDPMGHVLLAGALSHVGNLGRDPRIWGAVDDETRRLWERDRPILEVAQNARKARLSRALLTLRR